MLWELAGSGHHRQRNALRLIAFAFLALACYIAAQSIMVLATRFHAEHSTLGIAWTALTRRPCSRSQQRSPRGAALDNPVPRTEGRVTYIDGLLAVSVLVGLTLNALADAWWADPLAGFVIVYYGIEESDTLMLDALVRRDRDDPAVDLEHDRLAIQGPLGGVIAPPKQSRQDLGDLVHPPRARVRQRERFECRRIVSCRIANDHFFARATGIVLPVADHFVVGPLGDAVTLRPDRIGPGLRVLEWAVRDSNPRPLARHGPDPHLGGRRWTRNRRSAGLSVGEGSVWTAPDAVS